MKITDITTHMMGAPGTPGLTPSRNWIYVRVETDAGIIGLGEATTEWHEYAVTAMVERHLKPLLLGQDPTRVTFLWEQMQRGFAFRFGAVHASAISGIDQALWDITGKAYGQPVYKLLGGAVRDRVRLYARTDLGMETEVEEIKAAVKEGFTGFKFSGPSFSPYDEDMLVDGMVQTGKELREAAGPDVELMLDCQGTFSLQAAHRLTEGLRPVKMLFIEEPVNADTPRSLVALRKAFPDVRIAAGERVVTRWGFREWLETGAVDVIQADLTHCGGISELMRIAAMAEVYNVVMAPHNPYSPVSTAANLHACAAMPNFLILEHCRLRPWYDKVQVEGPRVEHGYAYLNDRPGLGVELDWDYVERNTFHPIPMRLKFDRDGGLILK